MLGGQLNADHKLSFQTMAVDVGFDGIEYLEFTDPNPFLQLFPHGRLAEREFRRQGKSYMLF